MMYMIADMKMINRVKGHCFNVNTFRVEEASVCRLPLGQPPHLNRYHHGVPIFTNSIGQPKAADLRVV